MTRRAYEIRVIGSIGPAGREAFADLAVKIEPAVTVLSGELDQRGLHAVLDRVRALGLELVAISRPGSLSRGDDAACSGSLSSHNDQEARG